MPGRAAIRVRPAEARDAAAVARMIRALARAEGGRSRMKASDVREKGLGQSPLFTVLVAEGGNGGDLLGYTLFFPFFDTDDGEPGTFLADLYVVPEARKRGVGRALMAETAATTLNSGHRFIVWTARPENAPALRFYRRLGAQSGAQMIHFVEGAALGALAERARLRRSRAREG
jgi:GNAT superfamily N-acetyltransferase